MKHAIDQEKRDAVEAYLRGEFPDANITSEVEFKMHKVRFCSPAFPTERFLIETGNDSLMLRVVRGFADDKSPDEIIQQFKNWGIAKLLQEAGASSNGILVTPSGCSTWIGAGLLLWQEQASTNLMEIDSHSQSGTHSQSHTNADGEAFVIQVKR